MCVYVCVCGESVCLALESAGVCHFQMNHRQTVRSVYEPQTDCTCIMNHITTYRDLYNHRQTGRPVGSVMEAWKKMDPVIHREILAWYLY